MVVSSIDGRLRIRHQELLNPDVAERLKTSLGSETGVQTVAVNTRVGSLLITYDTRSADREALKIKLSPYMGEGDAAGVGGKLSLAVREKAAAAGRALSAVNARKAIGAGMLGSLLLSMIGALFGAKTLHIVAGLVFLLFMMLHLLKNGNMIFS
jgi:heavy-metal-associated domain-containing protein